MTPSRDDFEPFSFAFQPIIDVDDVEVLSYEVLVRGPAGESAWSVLHAVEAPTIYAFDELLRREAIRWVAAQQSKQPTHLNLNMMPRGLEVCPSAIASTVQAAIDIGWDPSQLTLEITESEIITDIDDFVRTVNDFRRQGVHFAIDDFGAGYAGLNLLAQFQPDSIKLDLQLVRNIESHGPRQAIVWGLLRTCMDLGIEVVAEGVETESEFAWLHQAGVSVFQGYLFAKPGFEQFPIPAFPTLH